MCTSLKLKTDSQASRSSRLLLVEATVWRTLQCRAGRGGGDCLEAGEEAAAAGQEEARGQQQQGRRRPEGTERPSHLDT